MNMKRLVLAALTTGALTWIGCAPGGAADSDRDEPVEDDAHALSPSLMGIHSPATSPAGFRDMLTLFGASASETKVEGWAVETGYAVNYDWLGGSTPPASAQTCLTSGGDGLADKVRCLSHLGFTNVMRLDYGLGDTLPPQGKTPFVGGVRRCPTRNGGPPGAQLETHLECYLRYVRRLVTLSGTTINTWIVGNEINLPVEAKSFANGYISASWYADVHKATRQAIRSIPGHASDKVLVGAPSPSADSTATRSGMQTWTEVLNALEAKAVAIDGFAVHAYGGWPVPADNGGLSGIAHFEEGAAWSAGYRPQLRLLRDRGYGQKPVIITEYAINAHMGSAADGKGGAKFIREVYDSVEAWNASQTPKIKGAVYYSWQNDCNIGNTGVVTTSETNALRCMKAGLPGSTPSTNPYHAFVDLARGDAPPNPPDSPCTVSGIDNCCHLDPSTPGVPATFPGGVCDANGNGSFDDVNWSAGWYCYQDLCEFPCSQSPSINNCCHFAPSTPAIPQTYPGGVCDPNANGSFDDADWGAGWHCYHDACGG